MLKLTYTESSFYLECLTVSLEEWVSQRVILSVRVGNSLSVEPYTASFLLPVDLPGVERLKAEVKRYDREIMALAICDEQYMEVTLEGSWLSNGSQEATGIFVASLSDRTEFFLHQLWQEAQACSSVKSAEC